MARGVIWAVRGAVYGPIWPDTQDEIRSGVWFKVCYVTMGPVEDTVDALINNVVERAVGGSIEQGINIDRGELFNQVKGEQDDN